MKMLLFNLLFFCFVHGLPGQVLSGDVKTATGQTIPAANVLLLKSVDTTLAKAAVANNNGQYSIATFLPGSYFLRISASGYQTLDSPVFEITGTDKEINLGVQVLKEYAKDLGEVVVRAEKPFFQQQAEGTIINAESSLLTKGSSVLQLLERSPGVFIDHRNNSIGLNGKSGVAVMINGKLLHLTMEQVVAMLSSMSADDIATIELLTTPPAKYDAEGSGGLINIVLKKNKRLGTNAALSLSAGYGWREKGTGNFSIAHNTKRVNLYGSYTFSHNKTYSDLFITGTQNMPFLGGQTVVEYKDTTQAVNNNLDVNAGIDIKLSTKTAVGGSIGYNSSGSSSNTVTRAGYNVLPDSLLLFNGNNNGINRWKNLVSSIYLEKTIREGEKLNIDMDYLYFNNAGHSAVHSSFIDKHGMQAGSDDSLFAPGQMGFGNTTIKVGVAKIDYSKQLSKTVKFETGIKGSYTKSPGVSGIQSLVNGAWTSSAETSNHIVMTEGIGAAYASFAWRAGADLNLAAGVRYEYSNTNMHSSETAEDIVHRKLGALFPDLFLTRKISDHSELQLSYTKRISRPSYNDLASYVGYSDPTAVYTGNPFLKPTITNNLKIGYNYRRYSFSVLASSDKNAIVRYQLSESPAADILYISPQNLARLNAISLQANLPFKISNWYTMSYGFTAGPRWLKGDYSLHPFEKNYIGYSLNFVQAFKLPKSFSAELSGWYNSRSYNGTTTTDGYGVLNLGIKKELKNSGGSFQLAVSDLLRSERINVRYGAVTEEPFSIKSHVEVTTESARSPVFMFTYSKSFGTGAISKKEQAGSSEEKSRVRKD